MNRGNEASFRRASAVERDEGVAIGLRGSIHCGTVKYNKRNLRKSERSITGRYGASAYTVKSESTLLEESSGTSRKDWTACDDRALRAKGIATVVQGKFPRNNKATELTKESAR